VARNPLGREIGTIEVTLNGSARSDPLFGGLPERIRMQSTHVEAVVELPSGARRLGSSAGDPNQAFAVGERAWGVQFHPEFDADVVRGYLSARRELLLGEGFDPEALQGAASDSPHGAALLRRFAALLRD
jgi:GMP synthase (glutamine-hydrolysing)